MDDLADFWVHTVTVTPYLGQGTDGADLYGTPVTVQGFLEESTRLVRAEDGQEVVSSATFYCPTSNAASFPLDAKVASSTRTSRVLTVNVNDSGSLGLPDHLAVSLV